MSIKRWLRNWLLGDPLGVAPIDPYAQDEEETKFTISKAINGYVITLTKCNSVAIRGGNSVTKKAYLVPQGESIVNGLTYLLASERLE
jgi:hypothetical protein